MSGPSPNTPAAAAGPIAVREAPAPQPSAVPAPTSGNIHETPPATAPRAFSEPSTCELPPAISQLGVNGQGVSPSHVPKVGMIFDTEKEAYDFYNNYARCVGFSIRRSFTKTRADGTIYCKYLVCSNEGLTAAKHRTSTRSDCKARLQFYISREGKWTVKKVELDHNHFLVSPDRAHTLRSQRRLLEADQQMLNQMRRDGITAADIQSALQQCSGGAENIHLLKKDSEKKYLQPSYAQTLLEYLKNKQSENPSFFYAVQMDDDGQIANFFWTDGQAIVDYACFGDAVSFDTTFETNRFEMPFAPFVGTNHHKQPIIFGAALLYDESSESFVWLFQTFLTAMSGKQPATIVTDQSAEISTAVRLVFSNSSHRLCLRHISHNAVKHLSYEICNHPQFLSDFKECMYEQRSIECFDSKWKELIGAYNLEGNAWIENLYASREKWAAVYCRDSFCADLMSTQHNEVTNSAFERFRRKLHLPEFLEEYDKLITSLRQNELEADHKSRHSNSVPYIPDLPMLKTAADSYTRTVYVDFEEEFKKLFILPCSFLSQNGTISTYKLSPLNLEAEAYVVFNSEDTTISCSCKMYECKGMLCKHALRVLNYSNIFTLPSHYILKRWTKQAKAQLFCCRNSNSESLMSRCARVSQKIHSVAVRCSMSEKTLQFLEAGVDKLSWEVENFQSQSNLNSNGTGKPLDFYDDAMTTED
ncbi:hypothetical protein U9M48_025287 [Paspalum notatum var. saurae]|uniref:SWIM-type domain-containing protein n=1 Tax=Paspalum notatum var. saurae TaxID=547442 RepID=A0AAQ3TSZ1_PASNO